MKKTLCTLTLSIIVMYPAMAFGLVKLKNVSQTGVGNTGTVKIEFNGDYSTSKIKTVYEPDYASFILSDAFVIPVKRVFKSSSEKSSILKMEASQIPSNRRSGSTVKLNVYFRVPIDSIKKTGALSGKGNVLTFTYKTSAAKDVAASAVTVEKTSEAETKQEAAPETLAVPEGGIQDNGDHTVFRDKDKEKDDGVKAYDWMDKVRALKSLIFKLLKIAGILLGVLVILFLAFFFFKKKSSEQRITASEATISRPGYGNDPIRIISSSKLEDGNKLYVVDVLGEKMLIGTSKSQVSMISKLDSVERGDRSNQFTEEQETLMRNRLKDKLRNL